MIFVVHMAHADLNPFTAKHRTVYVQETAGFNRVGEPVDTETKFPQPMQSKDKTGVGNIFTKGVRVFRITDTDDWEEIMFQAYDIRPYHWNRRSETPELTVQGTHCIFCHRCSEHNRNVLHLLCSAGGLSHHLVQIILDQLQVLYYYH